MESSSVAVLLERICTLLRNDVRQRGLPLGLPPVQVEALLYLARCNRYSNTPQAVAGFLSSTKGTVSQTLKVLERRGLLIKTPDPEDGRVVRLQLTPEGERLARELAVPPILEQALATDDLREEMLAAELASLLAALQRAGDYRSFGVCQTCRFFRRDDEGFRCGLTEESLTTADSTLICREHELSRRG